MRPLKVAIATVGRFWLLDLARELARLGHDVAFWSIVPRTRAKRFGLPPVAHRALLPWLFPLAAAQRYGGLRLSEWANPKLLAAADRMIARRLGPCDVFIGLSALCVESARAARERYGAKVFIERGSRHIRSQKAILDDLGRRGMSAETVPDYAVERELAGYALADRIVIPSRHVEDSFVEQGISRERLFRNPYGVDLSMFSPTPAPPAPPTLLFVGTWSYRKGVDVLQRAWRQLPGVQLRHVGAVGDAPLPVSPGFEHIDPVPQWRLREHYGRAHVFVLASREEGLSLVQAQALACGLPLVCTDRTGGGDLQSVLDEPGWVSVVPADDADALAAGIREMLPAAMNLQGERRLLRAGRDTLAWAAYGRRYADELARVVR